MENEKENLDKDNEVVEVSQKEVKKSLLVSLKWEIVAIAVVVFGAIFIKYYSANEYYSEIPVIINANDYIGVTVDEVVEMYGEPEEKSEQNYKYYFDDYVLEFRFENFYVAWIRVTPKVPITYKKSEKEIFYMFGLGDDFNKFRNNNIEANDNEQNTTYNVLDAYSKGIEYIAIYETQNDSKVVEQVCISYEKKLPEKKVFEGDFSEVKVVYDLFEYLDTTKYYVEDAFGEQILSNDTLKYETDIGEIYFYFEDGDEFVTGIRVNFSDPMKYDVSVQEALVMFAVDPNKQDIYLYEIEDNEETYVNVTDNGNIFEILQIDREEKTFGAIYIK